MYKKWLKEQLKNVRTLNGYTILKAELDRIERIEDCLACQEWPDREN